MTISLFQYALAFLTACVINGIDLVTTEYPRSFFLIKRSWEFYAYCLFYGAIAVLLLWLAPLLKQNHLLEIGVEGGGMWVLAIIVGLFTKPLMTMRVVTIKEFPFGTETLAMYFEAPLRQGIEIHHHYRLRAFLSPYLAKYDDIRTVRQMIVDDIPDRYSRDQKAEVKQDTKDSETVSIAFQRYIERFGEENFKSLFPLS